MMKIIAGPVCRIICFFDRSEGTDLDYYGKLAVVCFKDMFWQAGLIFAGSIALVVAKRDNSKIFNPVITFIPIDVVNTHSFGNVPEVPNPDQAVQKRPFGYLYTAYRHFAVWAGCGAVIPCDFCASPTEPRAPVLPEKFTVISVIKRTAEFFFGRKRNSFYQLTLLMCSQ